ncbi:MAG: S8 family serine peptidase [Lachnospiraceae bacterium]|nr:S8 family serine peptidase [Lachnospiraceae bacterium]
MKNKHTKQAIAVVLSAALALTPSYTAFATEVSESAVSESSAETETSKVAEESVSETTTQETDANDEVSFEQVDAEAEGIDVHADSIEGETTEIEEANLDPDQETRVIIVLEGDSVLDAGFDTDEIAENKRAVALSEQIVEEQEAAAEKISEEVLDGEELDVNYNFTLMTNAFSTDVTFKDIAEIEKVDGVAAVYVAQQYEPMVDAQPQTITSGDMVGGYTTWDAGYTGAGTRIAIIDTGIDSDHPSFDGGAYLAHLEETAEDAGKSVEDYNLLDEEELDSVLPQLNAARRFDGLSGSKLYVSPKIPFAFNYIDKNLEITHDNDDEGDHGTHVSGISTANVYVPNAASETGYSKQASGVVGVAPDAQLITMKVFGANGGAYTDDYMAAIEDALVLDCDVVNLSLGSSAAGYSLGEEEYINDIFKKLEGTSTVVSISAGNSGRWADNSVYGVNLSEDVNQDTVGSPGSYINAFTVASAVNSGYTGFYIVVDGNETFLTPAGDSQSQDFHFLDTSADQNGTDYPFVFFTGKGEASDYEGIDVKDKIVLVSRGNITFGEKQMNAEAAGAKGLLVYNNTAGTISMTLQGSTATKCPTASIQLSEAQAIAKTGTEISEGVFEGTLTVKGNAKTRYNVPEGYTMSDFSSYGVPSSLDLKPEITAPGGNVFSTIDHGQYDNKSGTSMAAPSISGQSALLSQYIKENNLAADNDISIRTLAQSLIMSTATPLHEGNDPEAPVYSPRSQGAGLANVNDAINSPSYILVGDKEGNDGKVKVVLGDDPEKTGNYSFDFDIYNMSEDPQYYVLDSTVMTEKLYEEGGVKYFAGTSYELSPQVTLSADNTSLVYDLNEDGRINSKDRKVFLQVVNNSKELSKISGNEKYYDLNGDGVVNTKDVYAFNKQLKGGAEVADLSLELVEVTDSTKINVSINLSDEDRAYLAGFENGMYVDGFIYVNGNVNLSVPFLAFYGSWMDSSMFEHYDFLRAAHDPAYAANAVTYTGVAKTNFLSIFPEGDEEEMYYKPNLFAKDAEYIADRNAISSENGTKLGGQYYSLMRNAGRVILTVTDRNTGEVYLEKTDNEGYASFFAQGAWQNRMQVAEMMWAGTDASGNPLPDGTQVDITLQAIPTYYNNVEDPKTLKAEGMYLTTPMTIDNEAPALAGMSKTEDGKITLSLNDNRYTAAVLVISADKKTLLGKYAVNQTAAGEDWDVTIDAPEGTFYVEVLDYAMNSSIYRLSNKAPKAADQAPADDKRPEDSEDAKATDDVVIPTEENGGEGDE